MAIQYMRGSSQWDIANQEGVSQGTISNDLQTIRAEWIATAAKDFGVRQAEELAKLDHLEAVAWDAWERSKRIALKETNEESEGGGENGGRNKYKREEAHQVGDDRFLGRVMSCIELRMKVFGMIRPPSVNMKFAQVNNNGASWELVEQLLNRVRDNRAKTTEINDRLGKVDPLKLVDVRAEIERKYTGDYGGTGMLGDTPSGPAPGVVVESQPRPASVLPIGLKELGEDDAVRESLSNKEANPVPKKAKAKLLGKKK